MIDAPTIDEPAYFDRLAEVEARHWWARGMWRLASYWLDEALRGRAGLRALDLGCGAGMTLVRLLQRAEIAEAVGLDPEPHALRWSRRRHDRPLILGDALRLPIASRSFDVLTCFDVVQHLPTGSMGRAAVEIRRVLRPGGAAVVRSNGRGLSGGGALRLAELTGPLEAAGLVVRRSTYANFLPAIAQEVAGRIRSWRGDPGRPHPGGGGLRIRLGSPLHDRLMGGVSAAEALATGRLGMRLPMGHSTMAWVDRPSEDVFA